jgi:hypothetical protein
MGCKVPYDICTICGHKSKTRKDYCNCIRYIGMGKILDDGRRIGVINTYPRFFDISFVFIGADKTAKVMCKLASSDLWVPQSVSEGEWLYGADESETELVKAASVQVPGNFLYLSHDKTAEILPPPEPLHESAEDSQGRTEDHRAVEDGAVKTNSDVNEAESVADTSNNPDATPYRPGSGVDRILRVAKNQKDRPAEELKTAGTVSDSLKGGVAGGLGGALGVGGMELLRSRGKITPTLLKNMGRAAGEWGLAGGVTTGVLSSAKKKPRTTAKLAELDMNTHYGSFKPLWEAAKKITIGPPPKPNRKEYPFTGTINFRGLMIHVENKPGTIREGKSPKGKKWRTMMRLPYGEFKGSLATDGDKLDVYVGPYRKAQNVYIIHQNFVRGPNKGKYDEDKVMIGFENSEQAKEAYLAHYDSKKYFRSMTVMAFPLFKKALERKEVHGEKVAEEMQKIAVDLKLEDLFGTAKIARRRQRTWKHPDGKVTNVTGSGLGSMDMAKQASAEPERPVEELFGKTSSIQKRAEPLEPAELLKVSNDPKTASHLKWADIVKDIGPSKAVGKVSPMLSDSEPELPKELLNEMGSKGLEEGLTTPSLMGMVLKPKEFQRVALTSIGKCDLADKLDDAGAVFKPTDEEIAPCHSLEPGMMAKELLTKLFPFLSEKSYLGPPVRKRIIRITIVKPDSQVPDTGVDSPLLSKVAAAYTWYRNEQMKLAYDSISAVQEHPELHAALYGSSAEDLFGKTAEPLVNPKTLGMVLGSIPLTLMYSAHLRSKKDRGDELGMLKNMVAEHPWLTTLAAGAGIRQLMKTRQAQQVVDEVAEAGKRIWYGAEGPAKKVWYGTDGAPAEAVLKAMA